MQTAIVKKTNSAPPPDCRPEHSVWQEAEVVPINHFRPESSDHHPATTVRLLYTDSGIHLLYEVHDRFVRCRQTGFNAQVCRDSCVEFFVKPLPDKGYLNFETNCGGTLLAYYIADWQKTDDGFADYTPLTEDDTKEITIAHTLPQTVEPEIQEPTDWFLQLFVPFSLITKYTGCPTPYPSTTWHANFYKCGDQTSHPHWAAWSPVKELNFHDPSSFGQIIFQ